MALLTCPCLLALLCVSRLQREVMPKYSKEPENTTKSCKAAGSDLRVHFKNTCCTADAIWHDAEEVKPYRRTLPRRRLCRSATSTAALAATCRQRTRRALPPRRSVAGEVGQVPAAPAQERQSNAAVRPAAPALLCWVDREQNEWRRRDSQWQVIDAAQRRQGLA